ncbi:MICOS complex subunit Mic60 [Thrips palmi]|uniref:MICOS complex subunit MIC60 n=1 Tax=Thrips palmi TaxID=161013 RepID=A0A6P9ACD0_THRPL|nr:MICOS complex subunit Mic60 [Thrips palmi]
MLRSASKFSRYRQLELQLSILNKPCRQTTSIRHSSSSGQSKKRGFGLLKTLTGLAVVTGATMSYAKFDPDFREWLNTQVPYSSDAINILFQEDQTISERIDNFLTSIQDWFGGWFSSDNSQPITKVNIPPVEKKEVVPYTVTTIDKPKKQETKSEVPKAVTPTKVADLEREITKSTTVAVETYGKAINAIREQARFVQELVTSDLNRLQPELWSNLKEKSKNCEQLLTSAEENAKNAQVKMQEVEKLLSSGELEAPASVKEHLERNIKRMKADIEKACQETENEKFNTSVTKGLWSRVQEARKYWQDELEVLFPGLNLDDKNFTAMSDEIGQFVLYSYINVQYFQKELAKLEINADKKLRDAIAKSTAANDSSALVSAAVEVELANERRELDLKYQRKSMELRAACEQEIRKQLRIQTEVQADHLRDSIKLREMEIERSHRRELGKVLTEENAKYQMLLAALLGRMRGIHQGLQDFVKVDKSAQEAQDLWTACQILYRNLQSPKGPQPLANEVNSIQKIAESDELVKTVLKSLPSEVSTRGVYPLRVLRERFLKVEKAARTLAAVPEDGGVLPLYLLSWVQSKLMWSDSELITQEELEDKPTAHELLTNYDLLSRARFWVDRGDLAQALRYMNLLDGASKSIAIDWMKEARIYLECQQAATVLVTHASAKGLMFS